MKHTEGRQNHKNRDSWIEIYIEIKWPKPMLNSQIL